MIRQVPWAKPRHSWGFEITLRHTTVGRTTLYEWSARRRDLWPHTTLKRDTHPWPRRHSNPHSQEASGRRPTPFRQRGHRDRLEKSFIWNSLYCRTVLHVATLVVIQSLLSHRAACCHTCCYTVFTVAPCCMLPHLLLYSLYCRTVLHVATLVIQSNSCTIHTLTLRRLMSYIYIYIYIYIWSTHSWCF